MSAARRVLVVLDLWNIRASVPAIKGLSRRLSSVTRQRISGLGTAQSDVLVRRVYAPPGMVRAALVLGRDSGWRQGGTGESQDIVPYLSADVRAFCMEAPSSSGLVLCSSRLLDYAALIEAMTDTGVSVWTVDIQSGEHGVVSME